MPETLIPESALSVNLNQRTKGYPSPYTWQDQVLYFLLPDRFSDGNEAERPLFNPQSPAEYRNNDKKAWMEGGKVFQGGKIKGITSKLDYLKNLGVSALWVGPIWQQRLDLKDSYHGYGIQNFLNVDPRFGTVDDLIELVTNAHIRGMYVIFDIIYNHTGNNWFYEKDGKLEAELPYRFQPEYPFGAWRSGEGAATDRIQNMNDGVWPKEFQNADWYTRAGRIEKWDPEPWEDPMNPDCQFRRGDFFAMKDLDYCHEDLLAAVTRIYQYWIALTDCDGFRIDTVKHLPWEVSRKFCGAIHEFAESLCKENFLLVGEVTGGDEMLKNYLDIFGRNIDAGLDIGIPAERLEKMVKGIWEPVTFFDQFGACDILGSHRKTGRYHVSVLNDHDQISRSKNRFAAHNEIPGRYHQVAHAVGVQLTTLGIPCIYYGTEQAFDGTADRHDFTVEPRAENGNIPYDDRYIRESMFGGTFGAFETKDCHFFNPNHPTYLRIAAIAKIRQQNNGTGMALRRGRQYPRETSFLGRPFSDPGAGELIAWSRILVDKEVVVALNTNGLESRGAEVTVHAPFYKPSSTLNVLYRSDWDDRVFKGEADYPAQSMPMKFYEDGRVTVRVDLPPAGMMILG
jgi:glycosidase